MKKNLEGVLLLENIKWTLRGGKQLKKLLKMDIIFVKKKKKLGN